MAKCDIWIVQHGNIVKIDEITDIRILVDVEVPDGSTEPEKPKKEPSAEEKILKAWNRGERTLKEVMKITGYSYPTVRKYIPISPAG